MTISQMMKMTGMSSGTIASLMGRMGIRPIGFVYEKGKSVSDFKEYDFERMKERYKKIKEMRKV